MVQLQTFSGHIMSIVYIIFSIAKSFQGLPASTTPYAMNMQAECSTLVAT